MTRSNLHRCLQRHGLSRLKDLEASQEKKKGGGKFKAYPPSFIHLDISDISLKGKGKRYLFVAICRTTKLAIVKVYERKTNESSLHFLKKVHAFFPFKIHRLLTDNGSQFTHPHLHPSKRAKRLHPFEKLGEKLGIAHRKTPFFSPQTNGEVECFNRSVKEATLHQFHYESWNLPEDHLGQYLLAYNMSKKLRSLKNKSPWQFTLDSYRQNPKSYPATLSIKK